MTESYQNVRTKNVAVRIEFKLAERVTTQLHHGQQQALFRAIFESLDAMLTAGKLTDITNYIYKAKALTLKPVKD